LNTYYEIATDTDPQEVSIMRLVNDYKSRYQVEISIKDMAIALKELGYVLKFNVIKNIKDKKVIDNPGQKLL
jgi:hypothetical protein